MPELVHGILREVPPAGLTDPDGGPPLETVAAGPLHAVVSHTAEAEPLPTRAALLHHTRVLEQLAEAVTVLPMRFGVVVPDRDALVEEFLVPERDRLLATLDRLEGHLELRLRGRYVEDAVIREVLARDPRAAQLRGRSSTEDRMELGERIVQGIAARREEDRQLVLDRLHSHVADTDTGVAAEPLDAFTLSFLVADERRADFEAAVDALGEELGALIRLELIGPVPPFSFAATEEATWA